uniref:Uncharacterized protein n=1 Tax=Amphimedon queenslandica TaxID=400682 RepID=A0A1X7VBF9_AMPQE
MLQRFSNKWDSYIDITSASEIRNGDKVTICEKKSMKATELTLKGKALCSKLEKPSEANSCTLRSVFPSSSVSKRANSKAFDPLDDCIVAKEKRQ